MLGKVVGYAFLFVLWCVLSGIGLLWRRASARRARRRVTDRLEVTRIADCVEGHLVRVRGRIVRGDDLVAPVSGRRCVGYRTWVDGWAPGAWLRLFTSRRVEAVACTKLVLEDGSGNAVIDPGSVQWSQLLVHDDVHQYPTRMNVIDHEGFASLGIGSFRAHSEGVLEAGMLVDVVGMVMWDPAPAAEGHYREGSTNRVRIVPPERSGFAIAIA